MNNRIRLRKLNRTSSHRDAMFRNMVTSLIEHDRIRTTLPKAKELKRIADKAVTWAKKEERQYRTKALGYVRSVDVVNKLWNETGPRYADRNGGYTRVMRCGFRTGDRAPMAVIEFVAREGELRPAKPGTAQPAAAKAPLAVAAAAIKAAQQQGAKSTVTKKEELR